MPISVSSVETRIDQRTRIMRVIEWLSRGDLPLRGNPEEGPVHVHGTLTNMEKPCKSCIENHTKCDGKRPRCSHCLKEQLMCFYVGSGKAVLRGTKWLITRIQCMCNVQVRACPFVHVSITRMPRIRVQISPNEDCIRNSGPLSLPAPHELANRDNYYLKITRGKYGLTT